MILPHILITRSDLDRLDTLLCNPLPAGIGKVGEFLLREISRAEIVHEHEVPPTRVTMGCVVHFRDDYTNRETVGRLVFPEAAQEVASISVLTPVGAALVGLSEGQTIAYEDWAGRTKSLTVLGICEREPNVVSLTSRRPRHATQRSEGDDPGPRAA
jgi:regulator of nucleoside diphosphate kinase